eukprot:GHRR01020408.1.p1 GENE.GHRR01020408.1~~GHRR01020408.1.p1  ORF type:complete len:473 (+),score=113.43 GHRR01020408.1:178-1419(+)
MMDDLSNSAGLCTLTPTGIIVSSDNLAIGLKFSWPTYKNGMRILIHAELQQGSTWAFAQVFHWSVWLALGGTALAVGLLVAVIESVTPYKPGEEKKGWHQWVWYVLAKIFHVITHVGDPATDAARILVLGYAMLVLVMISMYTATSASRFTAKKLVHSIQGPEDLPGRRVVTWEYYTTTMERYNVNATGMPWNGEADQLAMIEALRAGEYDALVLDTPVLEHAMGTDVHCNLFVVGDPFETFSLSLAFPAEFDDALVFAFSEAIVKLQTYQGGLDMLENVYIKAGGTGANCFGSGDGHGSGERIELHHVSGLWYILCISVGLCFILLFFHNIRKDPKKQQAIQKLITNVRASAGGGWGAANAQVLHDSPGQPPKPAVGNFFASVTGAQGDSHSGFGTEHALQPSKLKAFLGLT